MRFGTAAALVFLVAAPLAAQETPTEREAARDVIRKMSALEQSIDVPALVTKLTGPNAARDAVVARAEQLMQTELVAMGDSITRHPEVGFQETRSVKILTDYLKAHDFDVETGVAGLPTAFVARYRRYGGTNVQAEPGKPQGFEETGSVSSGIPGLGFSAQTSTAPAHTYEMEADALAEIGHRGFVVDAKAMTALLYDFATRPEYRATVKQEFDGLKALFGEYQDALRKTYVAPKVGEAK